MFAHVCVLDITKETGMLKIQRNSSKVHPQSYSPLKGISFQTFLYIYIYDFFKSEEGSYSVPVLKLVFCFFYPAYGHLAMLEHPDTIHPFSLQCCIPQYECTMTSFTVTPTVFFKNYSKFIEDVCI